MNIIGSNIRQLREHKCLTQDTLAEQCRKQGWNISRSTLAKIEAKVRRITDVEILALAKAMNIDVCVIFHPTSLHQ